MTKARAVPALHSTLRPDALADVVDAEYDLGGSATCAVWHRGFNDYYLIEVPSGRFVLRIYPTDKYWMPGESDVRFELDLLAHLHDADLPVVPPVKRRDGDVLGTIEAPEGPRLAALFAFASGGPKQRGAVDLRALGDVCAGIHNAASGFVTQHHRYHLDADLLLEMPVREIAAFLDGSRAADVQVLRVLADRVRTQIESIPRQEPFYGVIHADLHGGNCWWTDDGPIVLDFDHCGYGWRAYDLVAAIESADDDAREAFLDGYRAVREITQEEVDLLPAFRKARYIWNYGDILLMADHLACRGQLSEKFWDDYFKTIRELLEE